MYVYCTYIHILYIGSTIIQEKKGIDFHLSCHGPAHMYVQHHVRHCIVQQLHCTVPASGEFKSPAISSLPVSQRRVPGGKDRLVDLSDLPTDQDMTEPPAIGSCVFRSRACETQILHDSYSVANVVHCASAIDLLLKPRRAPTVVVLPAIDWQ